MARILAFTGAGGDIFYYTTGLDGAPQMQVFDNSASSFVVDFSDTALLSGIRADSLFQLVELGECAGVIGYSERLFWWGERNKQNNWDNLTFDGGFGGAGNNVPLGWTPDATFFAGGSYDSSGEAIWGGAYAILGDGATATRGLMTQIRRRRLQRRAAPAAEYRLFGARPRAHDGRAHAGNAARPDLQRVTGNFDHRRRRARRADHGRRWKEFIAPITPSPGFTTIPPDLVLRVYADGTPTDGAGIPGRQHRDFSHRAAVQHFAGARVVRRRSRKLRRRQRIHERFRKRRADGARRVSAARAALPREGPLAARHRRRRRERAGFVDDQRSLAHGGHAFGGGRGYGRGLGRDRRARGHVHFRRRRAHKNFAGNSAAVGQINWAAGQTLWVRVDTRNKRILCGVPTGAATSPNCILVLDYRSLSSAGEIESLGSVLFSTLSGKLYAVGRSRKWCPWNITANSCTLAERSDGTAQVFLGNGAAVAQAMEKSTSSPTRNFPTTARPSIPTTRHTFS